MGKSLSKFQVIVFLLMAGIVMGGAWWLKVHHKSSGPGRCLVLRQADCQAVKLISSHLNPKMKLAVAKLPTGTPVFAPYSISDCSTPPPFYFRSNSKQGWPGASLSFASNNVSRYIDGFQLSGQLTQINANCKQLAAGEVIGYLTDQIITDLGDYNFALYFSNSQTNWQSPEYDYTQENRLLKQLWP